MNILIIGFGSIGQKHVSAIRQIRPDAAIYALRSSKTGEVGEGLNNIYSFNEINVKLDFIIISNPTNLHEETIKNCLVFGCSLFIEKPVLSSLQNAHSLIKEISSKQIITYVACNMRFHPALQFLKEWLTKTEFRINEVNIYFGSYLPTWRSNKDFRTIYSSHTKMGGGVHLDLIHEIDFCLWLFGNPIETQSTKRSVSSLDINSVDYANFKFLYPQFTANIILNYFRRDPKREIEIVTDEDTLIINLIKNKIYSNVSGQVLYEQPFNISETYTKQLQYFLYNIEKQHQPMNSFEEGIESLKIALYE